jgi:hypothetical protein
VKERSGRGKCYNVPPSSTIIIKREKKSYSVFKKERDSKEVHTCMYSKTIS